MIRSQIFHAFSYSLLGVSVVLLPSTSLAQPRDISASTPSGVMLVEVHQEEGFSSDQYFWTRLGDASGSTLFYSDAPKEISTENFTPLEAQEGSVDFDDWSIVSDGDLNQWAYQSNLLFTWDLEEEEGLAATNFALYSPGPDGEEPLQENTKGALLPPDGWQVARYKPNSTANLPDGFDLQLIDSGQGVVLTNFEGFSLYVASNGESCNSNCYGEWTPVAAPSLAVGSDRFSIIERMDGSRQWAFKGQPLYRYEGDLQPGDAHGRDTNDEFKLALLTKNFTPTGVNVESRIGYGDIFTLNGKTLYFGSAFEKYWGGRNLRGSFEIAYFKGKRLGGSACVSDNCLLTWKPFIAPSDSTASGFWEIITRHDGTKQWAYKGFALYTNLEDQAPGEMRGHSIYDIAEVDGSDDAIARTKYLAEVGNALGGAGVYWSVAKP